MFALLTEGNTTADVSTIFSDALSGIQTDFMAMVAIALPVGLSIFAVFFAVKKGMKFFKAVS